MRGTFQLHHPSIFGARLHLHWSALVAAGVMFGVFARQPVHALLAVIAYFGVIVLHEAGHAYVAKQLGYEPQDVYVTFIHGACVFDAPDSEKDDATIAWGGVLMQLAIAIPLIVLAHTTPLGRSSHFNIFVSIMGFLSLFVAAVNLAPARGLDGAVAWRLVPILAREARTWYTSRKAAKDVLNRFKRR